MSDRQTLFRCVRDALQDGAGAGDARYVYPEAWAALDELNRLVTGLLSYAMAGPSNEASVRNRDDLVRRAKIALGIAE